MKTQSAKAKGRELQKKVAQRIREIHDSFRTDDVRSTSMGAGGEDVQLSPAVRDKIDISVECKSYATFSVYKHYDQAKGHRDTAEPVLVVKANYRKPLAIVDMDHYFDLWSELVKLRENSDD